MAPSRSGSGSGEWSDYVTATQFSEFLRRFEDVTNDTRGRLDSINNRLANGQSEMAVMSTKLEQTIKRTDDHSDALHQLNNTFTSKLAAEKATEMATEHAAKPFNRVKNTVISTVVTILITSACAITWELIIHSVAAQPGSTQTNVTVTPSH